MMRNLEIARKKLEKIQKRFGKDAVYARTFTRALNEEFKSLSVRFSSRQEKGIPPKRIIYSGYFNGLCKDQFDDKLYNVDIRTDMGGDWLLPHQCKMYREILCILAHEFRHGYQHRARKRRVNICKTRKIKHFNKYIQNEVNYLLDYDEIDAYAYAVAYELHIKRQPLRHGLTKCWINRTLYSKYIKKYAPPRYYKKFLRKVYSNYQTINNKT
jgi:hypothetical protein